MRYRFLLFSKLIIFLIFTISLFSFLQEPAVDPPPYKFPYKQAGLTERQAAAHMLSRFSYGATPGQVDEVCKMGLENWFMQQLKGNIPDDSLEHRLAQYDALKMSNEQVMEAFPRPIQVIRMAVADGIINKDSINVQDKKKYKEQLAEYSKQKNFRQQGQLFRQLINSTILRAAYSKNQLHEVLTQFWFNHFNVSLTKNDCALFIPAYERDAIRPNVTGKFEKLLLATAKSPAMLFYLDNFSSAGLNDDPKMQGNGKLQKILRSNDQSAKDSSLERTLEKVKKAKKNQGLNENYAREVMELHTLGVDGGYTQNDVTQAARVLTGWTVYPLADGYGNGIKQLLGRIGEDKLIENGFVHEGDFLFAMNRHDNKSKMVMGMGFPTNAGYEEGVALLKMLAHHKSTANFICKKLAVHFVSDEPPKALVDKMAKTFLAKDGDISEVLITMISAVEFWDKNAVREKIKSPFDFTISAVRALNADIQQPAQLFNWIEKMGQKIYYYQAPTGFPDKAQNWINTGALLNRMNYGIAIASGQMRGVKSDLLGLNNNHEPESASAALITYGKLLLPERDLAATIKRLTPLLTDPSIEKKLKEAAGKVSTIESSSGVKNDDLMVEDDLKANSEKEKADKISNKNKKDADNMLSQVVGIIIGSPEFQRK